MSNNDDNKTIHPKMKRVREMKREAVILYYEMAKVLADIADQRLYEPGYESLAAWCRDEGWPYTEINKLVRVGRVLGPMNLTEKYLPFSMHRAYIISFVAKKKTMLKWLRLANELTTDELWDRVREDEDYERCPTGRWPGEPKDRVTLSMTPQQAKSLERLLGKLVKDGYATDRGNALDYMTKAVRAMLKKDQP